MSKAALPKLIIAASDHDPDMLYATGFFVPDAFIFLQQGNRSTIVLSDLEIDRGRKEARVDKIVAYSAISRKLKKGKNASFVEHAVAFLRERKVRRAAVPGSFPLGLAVGLKKAGIKLIPQPGLFWPEREHKTAEELKLMKRATLITEAGMARGVEVLRTARIGPQKALRWNGRTLTSEILRAEIESAILRAGGLPAHTIVAGGAQACDPHERGEGPLRAHELIILDLFPRAARSGYFGDLTRTVVRGKAKRGPAPAVGHVPGGTKARPARDQTRRQAGKAVQDEVREYFTDAGLPHRNNARAAGAVSSTVSATAWVSRSTNRRASGPRHSTPDRSSPSNPASTSPASAACATKTSSPSPKPATASSFSFPKPLEV